MSHTYSRFKRIVTCGALAIAIPGILLGCSSAPAEGTGPAGQAAAPVSDPKVPAAARDASAVAAQKQAEMKAMRERDAAARPKTP